MSSSCCPATRRALPSLRTFHPLLWQTDVMNEDLNIHQHDKCFKQQNPSLGNIYLRSLLSFVTTEMDIFTAVMSSIFINNNKKETNWKCSYSDRFKSESCCSNSFVTLPYSAFKSVMFFSFTTSAASLACSTTAQHWSIFQSKFVHPLPFLHADLKQNDYLLVVFQGLGVGLLYSNLHVGEYLPRLHIIWILLKVTFLAGADMGWDDRETIKLFDFVEVAPCNCQFPPQSRAHWLTRYLCNDRNTVLECFWVGSLDRIQRATVTRRLRKAGIWEVLWVVKMPHLTRITALWFSYSVYIPRDTWKT